MKPKMILKISIDLVMTVLLLFQMAYLLIGNTVHERSGAAMLVLFIFHHGLNIRWYRNLFKGRYSVLRIFQTVVNFSMLFCMLGLMVSGIIMSRDVFSFLPIDGGMGFARILHMVTAYWGFLLMSVHLGLHWGIIMGIVRKIRKQRRISRLQTWILRILAALISGFGIYAFLKHNLISYMLLENQFVFFNMQQPLISFITEYIAMMGLWTCLGHCIFRFLVFMTRYRREKAMITNDGNL